MHAADGRLGPHRPPGGGHPLDGAEGGGGDRGLSAVLRPAAGALGGGDDGLVRPEGVHGHGDPAQVSGVVEGGEGEGGRRGRGRQGGIFGDESEGVGQGV